MDEATQTRKKERKKIGATRGEKRERREEKTTQGHIQYYIMSTTTTVSSSVPSSLPTLSSSSSPSVTIAAPSSHTTAHTGLLPLPTPNVATIYTQTSVLDKPIPRGQSQVSVAAFSYLFSEMVQYHQQRSDVIQDLEKK